MPRKITATDPVELGRHGAPHSSSRTCGAQSPAQAGVFAMTHHTHLAIEAMAPRHKPHFASARYGRIIRHVSVGRVLATTGTDAWVHASG